jgi:hypothetical protein
MVRHRWKDSVNVILKKYVFGYLRIGSTDWGFVKTLMKLQATKK